MQSFEEPLREQLHTLTEYVLGGDEILSRQVQKVSLWSVSQQIDHTAKVFQTAMKCINGRKIQEGKGINLLGKIILKTGYIPRGIAKSPEPVRGIPRSGRDLLVYLSGISALLDEFFKESSQYSQIELVFPHPYFGMLNRPQALRFIQVHNNHHFKIIRDILR